MRAMNHKAFTRMSDVNGSKAGNGGGGVEGMGTCGAMEEI